MKHVIVASLGCLLLLGLVGCKRHQPADTGASPAVPNQASGGQSLKINGSDTMVNLGQAWAEAFMQSHPGVDVQVTGGGSGTGIAALIDGTTDIAQCSRAMKDEEIAQAKSKGRNPVQTQVGWDGLAVIVHPSNPVSELTIDQLADIFTGRVANWKDVGGADHPIVVLSRESNSGTHVYFKEHVLNKGDSKGTEEYAAEAMLLSSSQAIHDEVMNNESAIGYLGLGYVDDKVKALKVARKAAEPAVAPEPARVLDHTYPISRPLFVYTDGDPAGLVKQYIDFCLSSEGQRIVSELDFVPLKSEAEESP